MITHAIDSAVTNSWLEYRVDAVKASVPPKQGMDLLKFRTIISDPLIYVGQTSRKKRGRPSTEEIEVPEKNNRKREQV